MKQESALFLRLPKQLDDSLRTRAERLQVTPQQYIRGLLVAALGERVDA